MIHKTLHEKQTKKSSDTNLYKSGKGITLGYSSNVRVHGYQSRPIYQILYFIQIIIEVKRGSDWEGDIAIDDIKLAPGLCGKNY